jgi:hypothetical protein
MSASGPEPWATMTLELSIVHRGQVPSIYLKALSQEDPRLEARKHWKELDVEPS